MINILNFTRKKRDKDKINELNNMIYELENKIRVLTNENIDLKNDNINYCNKINQLNKNIISLRKKVKNYKIVSDDDLTKETINSQTYKPRIFYDSPIEQEVYEFIKNVINKNHLYNINIRLLTHQPVSNYVTADESTDLSKSLSIRRKLMHFDFVIELENGFLPLFFESFRKDSAVKHLSTLQHLPLVVIEFDGQTHNDDKQSQRDNYKNKICKDLNIQMIRITYKKFLNKSLTFERRILHCIFEAIFFQIEPAICYNCYQYLIKTFPLLNEFIYKAYANAYDDNISESEWIYRKILNERED